MDLERLDRFYITASEIEDLIRWKDNHIEFVDAFKSVLTEGLFIVTEWDGSTRYYTFQNEGDDIKYSVYMDYKNEKKLIHQFVWHRRGKDGPSTGIMSLLDYAIEQDKEFNESVIGLHASMMAYMEYYGDRKEYVEVNESRIKKTKKKKKGKKVKQPVYIHRKIYEIKVDEDAVIRDKVRYERHMEKWTVRGHWRTTKTGKKVWVKPHEKGKGTKEGKEYRVNDTFNKTSTK